MFQKFDDFVYNFLNEEFNSPTPTVKPITRPDIRPNTKPSTPTPAPKQDPSPFRRHKPGQMPSQRPLASQNLKNKIQNIIGKYSRIIGN